jgi:hypothetical protein
MERWRLPTILFLLSPLRGERSGEGVTPYADVPTVGEACRTPVTPIPNPSPLKGEGRVSRVIPLVACLLTGALSACAPTIEQRPFGLHAHVKQALRGDFYTIKKGTDRIPDFRTLHPKATVFAPVLNVVPQSSADGFTGLTDRNEWFALDYNATMRVTRAGTYAFRLASQDGSRLIIDGARVIDNDGMHALQDRSGSMPLAVGTHSVEVQYFKGRVWRAALQLFCTAPGGKETLYPQCGGLALETPGKLSDHFWLMWLVGLFAAAAAWWVLVGRKAGG